MSALTGYRACTRRRGIAAGTTLLMLIVLVLALAPMARAADAGIAGTVLNGTTATGAGNLAVTVQYFNQQGKVGTEKVTTDATGTFDATPPASAGGYQLFATYKGAEYIGAAAQLETGKTTTAKLTVFEPTTDPKKVVQTDWVIWVDQETGGTAVQQDFAWANGGDTAYVGPDGGGPVVTVPMPPDATNIQFLGTFLEARGDLTDGAYVSTAPIVPGDSSATIRYTTANLTELTLPVTFATRNFSLFVPAGLQASSPQLRLVGQITDNGPDGQPLTYQQYTSDTLTAGSTIAVTLAPSTGGGTDSNATTLLLGIAGLAVVAAIAFWLIGRRRAAAEAPQKSGPRKPRPAQPQRASTKTNGRTATAKVEAPAGNGQARRSARRDVAVADDDEVQLLIDEIAALDLSFDQGLLEERTYRRLRVAAKDRLLAAQQAHEGHGVPR